MKIVSKPEDVQINLLEEGNVPFRCGGQRRWAGIDAARFVDHLHTDKPSLVKNGRWDLYIRSYAVGLELIIAPDLYFV